VAGLRSSHDRRRSATTSGTSRSRAARRGNIVHAQHALRVPSPFEGEAMGNEAPGAAATAPDVDYRAVQQSDSFLQLKKRHRSFVFPVLVACLVWYFAYVLLAMFAHDFMSTPVFGHVNVAMLLGLAQIVTTFAVTTWYVSFANRRLDPLASEIRESVGSHSASAPEEVSR